MIHTRRNRYIFDMSLVVDEFLDVLSYHDCSLRYVIPDEDVVTLIITTTLGYNQRVRNLHRKLMNQLEYYPVSSKSIMEELARICGQLLSQFYAVLGEKPGYLSYDWCFIGDELTIGLIEKR